MAAEGKRYQPSLAQLLGVVADGGCIGEVGVLRWGRLFRNFRSAFLHRLLVLLLSIQLALFADGSIVFLNILDESG